MGIQLRGATDAHPIENVTDRLLTLAREHTVRTCNLCNGEKRQASAMTQEARLEDEAAALQQDATNTGGSAAQTEGDLCPACQTALNRVRQLLGKDEITARDCHEIQRYTKVHFINKLNRNPGEPLAHPSLITHEERGNYDVIVCFSLEAQISPMQALGYETVVGLIYQAAKPFAVNPRLLRTDTILQMQKIQLEELLAQCCGGISDSRPRPFRDTNLPTMESARDAGMPCWQVLGGTFPSIIGPSALDQLSKDLEKIKPEVYRLRELYIPESEWCLEVFEELRHVARAKYAWSLF